MRRANVTYPKGFKVLIGDDRSQAATIVIEPGKQEGSADNRHHGCDQCLLRLDRIKLQLVAGMPRLLYISGSDGSVVGGRVPWEGDGWRRIHAVAVSAAFRSHLWASWTLSHFGVGACCRLTLHHRHHRLGKEARRAMTSCAEARICYRTACRVAPEIGTVQRSAFQGNDDRVELRAGTTARAFLQR